MRTLGDAAAINTFPTGGLALSGAAVRFLFLFVLIINFTLDQVQRALHFWAIKAFEMEDPITGIRKQTPTLKPVINEKTGKVNTSAHAFNERNWGAQTLSLLQSAREMRPHRITEVMDRAYKYSKTYIQGRSVTETVPNHHQSQVLVDLSSSEEDGPGLQESDENCESLLFILVICYLVSNTTWVSGG